MIGEAAENAKGADRIPKLTPGHSRQAYPLMVWTALACELRRVGKLRMALFLLVSLSSYARPSEVIRLRTYCFVRPASWSDIKLVSADESRRARGAIEDGGIQQQCGLGLSMAVKLDSDPLWISLWDFDYSQYSQAFKTAASTLGLDLAPYQNQHSGPSIDRAKNHRVQVFKPIVACARKTFRRPSSSQASHAWICLIFLQATAVCLFSVRGKVIFRNSGTLEMDRFKI